MAKIMLVTRNFPPLTGGMERLVYELYLRLAEQHDCALVGPKGCKEHIDSDAVVREARVSPTPIFLCLSLFKGMWLKLGCGRPEVVIGGSGLVAPVVILLAKLFGAKSIVLVHGLDIVVDSRAYQRLFVPFLRRADLIICNSQNTARLALDRGVRRERIEVINPGVTLPKDPMSHDSAKKSLGLEGKTVLLSVGRLIPRKGLAEFLATTFRDLAARDADTLLLIAGSEAKDALNRRGRSVLECIEAAIESNGLGNQVRLLGRVDDDKLQRLYAAADVFVLPLVAVHGDVEGFGMVSIEAAAFGTPTVAFDCGGVGDAVSNGKNGYLVPAQNYAEFSEAVTRSARGNMRDSAKAFALRFSWENYYHRFSECVDRLV